MLESSSLALIVQKQLYHHCGCCSSCNMIDRAPEHSFSFPAAVPPTANGDCSKGCCRRDWADNQSSVQCAMEPPLPWL